MYVTVCTFILWHTETGDVEAAEMDSESVTTMNSLSEFRLRRRKGVSECE
jgi:hypothetical protein